MENDKHSISACETDVMIENNFLHRENLRILEAKTVRTNDNT